MHGFPCRAIRSAKDREALGMVRAEKQEGLHELVVFCRRHA